MSLVLLFAAQHVSNAITFFFRSLRLCVGILLWFDVCWCYGVVRLGWCGIRVQAEALHQLSHNPIFLVRNLHNAIFSNTQWSHPLTLDVHEGPL